MRWLSALVAAAAWLLVPWAGAALADQAECELRELDRSFPPMSSSPTRAARESDNP